MSAISTEITPPTAIVQRLADLHADVLRNVASAAVGYWQAGKILAAQQAKLTGEFVLWLNANRELLGFSDRTARDYLAFYRQHSAKTPAEIEGLTLKAGRATSIGQGGDVSFTSGLNSQFTRFENFGSRLLSLIEEGEISNPVAVLSSIQKTREFCDTLEAKVKQKTINIEAVAV